MVRVALRFASSAPRFRPRLEALEDRVVPATVYWVNQAGGNWDVGCNWSTGQVPTASDDVVINLASGGTVTHSQNSIDSVHSLNATQALVLSGGALNVATIGKVGQFTLDGGMLSLGGLSGRSLTSGKLELAGPFTWNAGTLCGDGTIDANGAFTIAGSTYHLLDGLTLNTYGATTWTGGNVSSISGASVVNRSGGTFTIDAAGEFDPDFQNKGQVVFASPGTTTFTTFVNAGSLSIQSGELKTEAFSQTKGSTTLAGGVLASSSTLVFNGGTLYGSGEIKGSVTNAGDEIDSGDGRLLYIDGNFTQESGGELYLTVNALAANDDYDQLLARGTAAFGGELTVNVAGEPNDNDESYIIGAGYATGTFQSVDVSSVPGTTITTQYSSSGVYLTANKGDDSTSTSQATETYSTTSATYPIYVNNVRASVAIDLNTPVPGTGNGQDLNVQPAMSPSGVGGAIIAVGAQPAPTIRFTMSEGFGLGQSTVGGANTGTTPGNRNADMGMPGDAASSMAGRATLTTMAAADRSSGRIAEEGGRDDQLVGAFPLAAPDLELPAEHDLLSTNDIARVLLVGGRARADILPHAGSQLSAVATVVTSDASPALSGVRGASPLAELFLNPLRSKLFAGTLGAAVRVEQPLAPVAMADAPNEDEAPVEEAGSRPIRRIGLATAGFLGTLAFGAHSISAREKTERDRR